MSDVEGEDNWVLIRTFSSHSEASIALGLLHSAGIPARLAGQDRMRPELSVSMGLHLQAPASYEREARDLLDQSK